MMHFIDPALDGEMIAELKDAGVLAPDIIDRIDAAMGRPESGTLNEFLLAGADFIPEHAWLSWLIRRQGCHRFGRVAWHAQAGGWARGGLPAEGNFPYRVCADGGILVAILRPDRRPATAARLKAPRLHWAAGTLGEIRKLRSAWEAHSGRA